MRLRLLSVLAFAATALTGCGGDDHPAQPLTLTPTDSSNCTVEWNEGTCNVVSIDGHDRYFYVVKPTHFNADSGMLMVLHGIGDRIEWQAEYLHAMDVAEATGRLLVMPVGTLLQGIIRNGQPVWNASAACCYVDNLVGKPYIPDDVAFLTRVIDDVNNAYRLNTHATALWGYSNGSFMANRMACERSSRVAAIVSTSGGMRVEANECRPDNPVSVLQIHGTRDQSASFQGDTIDKNIFGAPDNLNYFKGLAGLYGLGFFASAEDVVDRWLDINHCDRQPESVSTITAFSLFDNINYRASRADSSVKILHLEPEPELAINRDGNVASWGACQSGTTVKRVFIEGAPHKPVYDADKLVTLVSSFINAHGQRSGRAHSDTPAETHYQIRDSNIARVNWSSPQPGAAFVRDNGDGSWFVRASIGKDAREHLTDLELLDDTGTSLGTISHGLASYRYLYGTFKNVTGTPATLRLKVDGTVTTGAITKGSLAAIVSGFPAAGGDPVGQFDLTPVGNTRFYYTFRLNAGHDPAAIRSITLDSANKHFTLYPIPTGLPMADDYAGEGSWWRIVQNGGFKFAAKPGGSHSVDGFAEDQGSAPYYFEELTGDPGRYTVTIDSSEGVFRAPLVVPQD